MKTITAADTLNWRVEEQKEGNKNLTLLCFRKYLDEALKVADKDKNSLTLYYETLEHFKGLVTPLIETTLKGEYTLKFDNKNQWYHRDKSRIILSFYEFILKKICLRKNLDYLDGLVAVSLMNLEDIYKN